MKQPVNKLTYYYLLALIIWLPFTGLIGEILDYRTTLSQGAVFGLTHWYEPAAAMMIVFHIIIAFCHSLFLFCHSREGGNLKRIRPLVPDASGYRAGKPGVTPLISVALVAFGIVSVFFLSPSITQGLEGFRFTLFPILILVLAWLADLSGKQKKSLISIYLFLASLVASWALLERLLPANYLAEWGTISSNSVFGYGSHKVVEVLQSTAAFGGPNQLATYLLPAVFLGITNYELRIKNKELGIKVKMVIPILLGGALVLTFSRSAWVGLMVGVLIYSLIRLRRKWIPVAAVLTVVLIPWMVWRQAESVNNRLVMDIFTHGASQAGHWVALGGSIEEVKNRLSDPSTLFFGSGLGTSGPIALKYGGIISESWYFQILFELGLLGLSGWLMLMFNLIRRSWRINPGLSFGLISISVAALFLHTFADNPAGSITLFILLGIGYNQGTNEKNTN